MPVRRSSVRPPTLFSDFSFSPITPKLRAIVMAGAVLGTLLAAGNAHAAATTYTVNATTDTAPTAGGAGSGDTGDLRYAITQAEIAGNAGSTINITATGTITLAGPLPAISQDTMIVGPGANQLTISGANTHVPFGINSGATVSISGLTIANGKGTATASGGITNAGTLTITDCAFIRNSSNSGGAISNTGTLAVGGSAFINNSAISGTAGAILNGGGAAVLYNNTFYGNSSTGNGGAIYVISSNLTATGNTFAKNVAQGSGGGIYISTGGTTESLTNNVFYANSASLSAGAIGGGSTLTTEANNIFYGGTQASGNETSFTPAASDVSGQDPKLLQLGNYGGTTLTMLPQPGSPAVCAGSVTYAKDASGAALTTDQRSFALNAANCSNGGVDAGAVQTNYLMVTTGSDSDDGSCTTTTCSLRDAINVANTAGGDIGFNSSLNGSTITLASALPAISGQVEIVGPGVGNMTVSAGGTGAASPEFTVNSGAQALLYGLTITGANIGADGGAILNNGSLSLLASAVSGNTALTAGGILNKGALNVISSTISGNSTTLGNGGGLLINSSSPTVVVNSTIKGNAAVGGNGGGIADTSGTLSIINSTISSNTASTGNGGGISTTATTTIENSIVSGNIATVNADIGGAYIDDGGNLVGGTGLNLAALGNYGGTTQTMLPLPGSTALCAGSSSLAVDANGLALTTDQRGFAMGASSYCASGQIDAGAVQTNYTSAQFTNDTGYSALINQAVSPTPIVSVTENGQNIGGIPITLTFTPTASGAATGLGPVTTVAGVGATFSSIKVDTAGATDTLGVSLPVGSSSLTASANLEIDGQVALSPGAGALTNAYIGAAYSEQLSATGGKGGYSYSLSTGTLPSGIAFSSSGLLSGTPTALGSSSFSITATDKKGNTGSAAYTLNVKLDQTSVAVTSSKNPSNADDSVTFTATITNTSGGSVPSTGTVAFKSDGVGITGCGTKAVVAGTSSATATCSIDSLAAASSPHSIVATYSGDSTTYDTSASSALSQTVSKADTAVTVTSSGASGVNEQVTFTATVTPKSPVALSSSGTVTFKDGSTVISGCSAVTITAATGQAACSTTFATAASHTIGAVYNGDSNYNATAAGSVTTVTQTVSKATTSVSLASHDNTTGVSGVTSSLNDSVTFTAIVTPYNGTTALSPPFTGAATVTGTVSFASNGKSICSASVGVDGTGNYSATCTTATLPAGSDNIVATYSGNSGYSGSNKSLSQSVSKAATATAVTSSSSTSTVNQTVTFIANVTPFNDATVLSGAVTFTATNTSTSAVATLCNAVGVTASTGVATCAASSLTPGTYTISANYGSDSNYETSSGTVSQTVGKATTGISLTSSPNPSTVNQQVTLSATVTASPGANKLNGQVSFTDNGNAISDCSATTINPNTPTVVCKTTSLTLGSHSLVASYGSDSNFSDSSSTAVSQTVNTAPTSTALVSSVGATSTVDQMVKFTATVSGASGAVQFSGTMSFTDNGTAIPGCSSLSVKPTTGSAACSTSTLPSGSHAIAASYTGDTNFSTSGNSLTLQVNPGASSTTVVSSLNPSIALNPKNYQDTVEFTATVGPSAGVPLSGSVTFTDNGAPISECQSAVPVNPSTGTAACLSSSLGFGSHTILAVYNGDPNFNSSSGSVAQTVQDYTLAASPTQTVTVSQRFTNSTDVFTPQAITVSAAPISGFTGKLDLTCNVVPLSAPDGAVPPVCSLGSSTLDVTASGQQQPVALTVDAGSGSTPVATTGTYDVSIIGVDETTGLTHASASFVVNVRYQAAPLTIVSGATSGNASTVGFTLPPNVGLSDILCSSVTGPTLTSPVAPVALSMSCSFSPSTIPPAGTSQNAVVTVTVNTGAATEARLHDSNTTVAMAGVVGLPILLLLGFMPGAKSRKVFFRYLGIALAAALLFTGTGCGGGQFTAPPSVSGQTPPGSYNILVQGTGTDGQVYQAVVQVNVTR